MPRNYKDIDKKDEKILYLLLKNARLSQTKISKIVGMSRELVNYRIEKLLKLKYINSFNLVVSNKNLGFETFDISIKLQNLTNETLNQICDFLKKHPNIKHLVRTSGNWDISLTIAVKNKIDLSRFIDELNENYGDNIAENHIFSSISVFKHNSLSFLTDIEYEPKRLEHYYGKVCIDTKDRRILNKLSTNARMSIADLAVQTRLNPETCSNRFNRLVRLGVIKKTKATIDVEKFGMYQYSLLLKINKFSRQKRKSITNFLCRDKNVIFGERILGNYDIKIIIVAKNQKEFDAELTELRAFLKEDLKQYSFSIILETLKSVSYPKGMW